MICQLRLKWASQLLCVTQMFIKEFFFSFSLLVFTGILMILGIVLLVDALRRLAVDVYKSLSPRVTTAPAVVSTMVAAKNAEEKLPPLEEAA